jgi:bifunctional non-homologous end joining protein LigD
MAKRDKIPENKRSSARFLARIIGGAHPSEYPGFIEPSLANLQSTVPSGNNWVHELKLDGYRAQAHIHGNLVRILTRRGNDWTTTFAPIAAEVQQLKANEAIIDGEIVAIDETGKVNFNTLVEDLGSGRTDRLYFYAFDFLYLDGFDLRGAPLI